MPEKAPVTIAWFSPLAPSRSGVAKHNHMVLDWLNMHGEFDIDLWTCKRLYDATKPPEGFDHIMYEPNAAFADLLDAYDAAVYHIGNNPEGHLEIYEMALMHSGLVVLHDYVLHPFLATTFIALRNDPIAYIEEMAYAYGDRGRELSEAAILGEAEKLWETEKVIDFPLNERLIDTARAVIVHSRFAHNRIEKRHVKPLVYRVNLAAYEVAAPDSPTQSRAELGIPEHDFVIGCLGALNTNRLIPQVLRAVARLRAELSVRLVLAGSLQEGTVRPLIEQLGIGDSVQVGGYVSREDYLSYLHACDCCINLRVPTMGETSAGLIDGLAAGKPCIVSDVGWYSELPDDVVVKIPAHAGADVLSDKIMELASNANKSQCLAERGYAYVSKHHSVAQAVKQFAEVMVELVSYGGDNP